jgi:hypothetical protein
MREKTVVLRYVRSKENAADILTKALPREAHEAGKIRMGIRVLKFSLRSEGRCWPEPPTEKSAKVRPDL